MENKRLYIKNGFLIDGTGNKPVDNAGILIEGNKIISVGSPLEVSSALEWVTIDATGKTIMPGLIDCHSHMGTFSESLREGDVIPIELNTLIAANNTKKILYAGFTTVRNMGGRGNIEVSVRDAVKMGIIEGPRLLVAGRYITCIGGLMDYYPSWIESPTGKGIKVNGPIEVLKAVRELVKTGVDVIKLEGSGATVSPYCPTEKNTLTLEEMKVAVNEARRQNKRVAIHAETPQSIKDAIIAGVDTIEHAILLNEECVELMAKSGVYFIPTIGIMQSRFENIDKKSMPEFMKERVNTVYKNHVESLKLAYYSGVKIAVGTDTGAAIAPGDNAYELSCFVKHCFKPMEAIVAATKTAAEALGLEKEIGTLEINKLADLLVIDGNPLEDINILQQKERLKLIVKDGEIVKKSI